MGQTRNVTSVGSRPTVHVEQRRRVREPFAKNAELSCKRSKLAPLYLHLTKDKSIASIIGRKGLCFGNSVFVFWPCQILGNN